MPYPVDDDRFKPNCGIELESCDVVFVAIWEALNDPNLTAPTNPSVVEQLLAVGDHDTPRVVRDVFTVPGSTEETIARSFGIGLPGGHSVLFDLETCTVRGWTLGDFSRQRCEGKRWYWDLAGTVLASGFDKQPDISLVHKQTGEVIATETGWNVQCFFKSENRSSNDVTLIYEMQFKKAGTTYRLPQVVETFSTMRLGDDPAKSLKERATSNAVTGWKRRIRVMTEDSVWPWLRNMKPQVLHEHASVSTESETGVPPLGLPSTAVRFSGQEVPELSMKYETALRWSKPPQNMALPITSRPDPITTVPGFQGNRLALPRSIMPTALTWDSRQRLIFTSLKGHLYRIQDSIDPTPSIVAIDEGLAAPFGVIEHRFHPSNADEEPDLVVAHKPELLRLTVQNDGRIRNRQAIATGWGVTDDYHDWTCGIARDSQRNLYFGLGSDYTFRNRPVTRSQWRGDIMRLDPTGKLDSIARGLRYPTGLAIDDQDRLFCTDQQGVQNTFNELNFIQLGHRYGVPSRHETEPNAPADSPAVQIPHPWTRSVNGIAWVPTSAPTTAEDGTQINPQGSYFPMLAPFARHFLGCEFNNNTLIRMSIQTVGDTVQGAAYPFSKPAREGDTSNFVGPLCIGVSPKGELYIGELQDGGWAGGLNTGDIVKLIPTGNLPNGMREIRATSQGFDIEFFHKANPNLAVQTSHYKISGYTRIWKGDYATPDSGHHHCEVTGATLGANGRVVSLTVTGRKPGHVYDISVGEIGEDPTGHFWPAIGHYTLHKIPVRD